LGVSGGRQSLYTNNLDCSECISQYEDLRAHIFKQQTRTGKHASKFFTSHSYSAPIGINESSNVAELNLDDVDTEINCTNPSSCLHLE